MDSQKKYSPTFSVEFFPPKNEEGVARLRKARTKLAALGPRYASVTFGAGGSTQEGTLRTVREMLEFGLDTAPHLSCIGATTDGIRAMLHEYRAMGVKRIVALRGDMPSGMRDAGDFRYANELVSFIREDSGDYFHIEVAAYPEFHPQARTPADDMRNFVRKVRAGANAAITQYFFNPDAYSRFVEECERLGIDIPIVPGIMPITNYTQLARFSEVCGAEIPSWLRKRLVAFADDKASLRAFGLDVTRELCQHLLDLGAPGLHFYTLNRSEPVATIWKDLSLSERMDEPLRASVG